MSRFLRPADLLPSGDAVWLVDESWPAAARINADGAVTVVRWPASDTATYAEAEARVAVGDGVGIVVQDGRQVAWIRRTDSAMHHAESGLTLAAADPETAWLVDRTFVDPGQPGPDSEAPQAPPLPEGRIVALHRDGTRMTVATPAPVNTLVIEASDVVVTLAQQPVACPAGPSSWTYEYPVATVRVDRQELFAHGLSQARPVPERDSVRGQDAATGWCWLETDPQVIRRYGVSAGGQLWWAGAPTGGDPINRRVIAVGHDPTTGGEAVRVDLGIGLIHAARAVGDELWLGVARRRFLSFAPQDHGVDVLAVSSTGSVRRVYPANSIDITSSAPPLRRPTDRQIADHIKTVRNMFAHLDEFWRSPAGTTGPLSDGLTEPSVSVQGDWPHTRVVVTLRHRSRPGLLLRRTLPLFNDAGQPIDHQNADIYLMEDLDTHYLAPADEAVDGVLDT